MTQDSQTNGNKLLEIKNLRKYFPIKKGMLRREVGNIRAVDDVSFYINQGQRAGAGARSLRARAPGSHTWAQGRERRDRES